MTDHDIGLLSACIALAGLSVVLMGALVGVVWRGGTLVAELKEALRTLKEGLAGVRDGLKALSEIPLMGMRIEQLEKLFTKHMSDHRELGRKVDDARDTAMRAEMASQHEKDE